ncbi:MAG: hypothetical protein ABSB76_21130 [Streptosporangiaceae bacterium]
MRLGNPAIRHVQRPTARALCRSGASLPHARSGNVRPARRLTIEASIRLWPARLTARISRRRQVCSRQAGSRQAPAKGAPVIPRREGRYLWVP